MLARQFSFQVAVMEAWVRKIFGIFALIVYLQASIPSAAAYSCLNSTNRIFAICCDDGEIFDVNITSSVGECGESSCTGDTPHLLMQKLKCYWKNSCTIDLPNDHIIQSTSKSSKCIGEKPKVLVLYSWKCKKKGVRISDLNKNTSFSTGDSVILRSHSRFPWAYSIHDFNGEFIKPYIVTVTFWLRTDYTLTMTVDKVNVTLPDTLEWYTKQNNTSVPASVGTVHFDQIVEIVYLQLNLSEDSKGDSGFLICFKHSSNGSTIQNACSDLTTIHYNAKILKPKRENIKKEKGKKDKKCNTKKGKGRQNKKESTTRKTSRQPTG